MVRAEVKQANFMLPVDLIEELRRSVPRREQSKAVAEALRKELKRKGPFSQPSALDPKPYSLLPTPYSLF